MLAAPKWFTPPRWLDLLFPPDPAALRLLAALRATLAGVLAFVAVLALGAVAQTSIADRILGFAAALFIAATVRDGTPRQQLVTMAAAPFTAFAAAALAAFLTDQPAAAAVAVPPLMFVVAFGAARGPRFASIGLVALIAYIIGLVTHDPPATLPLRLIVLIVAAGAAALARFVLVPQRPNAELERLRRAVHVRIAGVLAQIEAAVAAGGWTDRMRADLRRAVNLSSEVIMMTQARVAVLAARLPKDNLGNRWLRLLTIELGVERLARIAQQDVGAPADRPELLAALEALRAGGRPPPLRSRSALAAALSLLDHALHESSQADPTPAAPPPAVGATGLRSALQTAVAAGLAVGAGELVSPNRWYWAAFTAFVMFQGTRSRAESLAKGMQFMIGTLAGAFVGSLTATLLSGHELLSLAAIVVAVFLAFQANVAAYGAMVFWITIILGLLFGMLGYFAPDLLLLRLKEASVGAICGALVASFVLARGNAAVTQEATVAFLRALKQAVDGAAGALLGAAAPRGDLAALIVTAEQRFRDVSALAQPELTGRLGARNEGLRRRMLLLEACEQWCRELGEIALSSVRVEDSALARAARQARERIDATLPALIEIVAARTDVAPHARSAAAPFAGEPAENLGGALVDEPPVRAVRLLLRIDAVLVHMASRSAAVLTSP